MSYKTFFISILILLPLTNAMAQEGESERLFSQEEVEQDLKFLVRKLERHHPFLYVYTSKEEFDRRCSVMIHSIQYPVTLKEYYFMLSLTLSSLKHGHMHLAIEDAEQLPSQKNALSQMQYEVFNMEVYVICTNTSHHQILPGSQLYAINGLNVSDLIAQYSPTVFRDGYSATHNRLLLKIPDILNLELGATDTLTMELRYGDSMYIYRTPVIIEHDETSIIRMHCLKHKNQLAFGFPAFQQDEADVVLPSFLDFKSSSRNRNYLHVKTNLRFLDSTFQVAYMSIDLFTHLNIFDPLTVVKELNSRETEHLIIDLRSNPGGALLIALLMQRFLADSSFVFLERFISKTRYSSVLLPKTNSLDSWIDYLLFPTQLPLILLNALRMEKLDKIGYQRKFRRLNKRWSPRRNGFKGKIYVITNSGTLSAANTLANNLQQSGRAKVFGTESGDVACGGVSGSFITVQLPHSKMEIRFGLQWIQRHKFDTQQIGRGVIPDYYVPDPSLDDIIQQKDPQMQFVLDYIRYQIEANQTIPEHQEPVEP